MQPFHKAGGYSVPGRADVHVDRPLTNLSIAFRQSADAFVADRVFPVVPVSKQTDSFFTIPRGAFLRDQMEKKAPGAGAKATGVCPGCAKFAPDAVTSNTPRCAGPTDSTRSLSAAWPTRCGPGGISTRSVRFSQPSGAVKATSRLAFHCVRSSMTFPYT